MKRRISHTCIGTVIVFVFFCMQGIPSAAIELPFVRSAPGMRSIPYTFNVKDYGAKGNAQINDAPAINKAIEAAAKAGGGTVYFPAGTYLSGSIRLKSHITLYLDQGATLQAIADTTAYDAAEPFVGPQYQDFGHSHWHNGFIWGENLEDVAIMGPGLIYGKGLTRNLSRDHLPKTGLGDKAIALKNCRNVILKDFSILHGGHFGILLTGVDNVTIDNLKIDTNRDGMDIDCCKNVHIENCTVNSPWDDGICPKSSFALGYARVTENLTINNCIVSGFQEGSVLDGTFKPMDPHLNDDPTGRIKLGTESNGGGFKNITISNCVFDHCRGLALETVDGGLLEDVSISNLTMRYLGSAPIFLRLGSRMRGPKGQPVGELQRINISNVAVSHVDKATGCIISGIPGHNIKDVKVSHVQIIFNGGGTKQDAAIQVPEKEKAYPEPNMFGVLPAYGFYVRHVEGIEFTDIKLSYADQEERPAFVLDSVVDADFRFIKAEHASGAKTFSLKAVNDFILYGSHPLKDTQISKAKETSL